MGTRTPAGRPSEALAERGPLGRAELGDVPPEDREGSGIRKLRVGKELAVYYLPEHDPREVVEKWFELADGPPAPVARALVNAPAGLGDAVREAYRERGIEHPAVGNNPAGTSHGDLECPVSGCGETFASGHVRARHIAGDHSG